MKVFYLLLVIILAVLSHWLWFTSPAVLTSGDWWFFFRETQKEFLALPQMWTMSGFGTVDLGLSMYPANVLWGLLGQIVGFAVSERVLYLIPAALFSGLTSYWLVYYLTKSRTGGFIGSIVYSYNTYILLAGTGHLTILVAFSLAPILLMTIIKSLQRDSFFLIIISGLISFMIGFYEFRALYLVLWVVGLYFLYDWVVVGKCSKAGFVKNIKLGSFFIFIIGLLNCYWILPLFFGGSLSQNLLFDRGLFGDSFMNIIQAITLFHPFWSGGAPVPFIVQPVSPYFFIIPVMVILGIWYNRHNKLIIFFALIALLGILLTKQSGEPFQKLYKWLFDNVPGFKAFRESSKFYFYIAISYSVLIGAFFGQVWSNRLIKGWGFVWRCLVTTLVLTIFIFNTKPFVNGEIKTLFISRVVPEDYLVVRDFLLKQNEFFRTLWFPTAPRWGYFSNTHPGLAATSIIQSSWSKFISPDKIGERYPLQKKLGSVLDQPFSQQLLIVSGIKYLIVPLQDFANDDDFFPDYGPRAFFLNSLDKANFLRRLDLGTKKVAIYENPSIRPHVYLTGKPETVYENLPYTNVEFEQVRPTEYHIRLTSLEQKFYLNFAENYNDGWRIHVGNFNWWDALVKKDYFLPDKIHQKSDAGLNSFELDPSKISKKNGSLEMTLYFAPQSYVYLGSVVSGLSLVFLLALITYLAIKKRGRN